MALGTRAAGGGGAGVGRRRGRGAGWITGLPGPGLVLLAPSWGWIVAANILLGINQGLCWSTTVIMKIDLVGPARRGLAERPLVVGEERAEGVRHALRH